MPPIVEGVVLDGSPCAGELFLQADVERAGVRARFDDVVGAGWRLVTIAEPRIDDDLAAWFAGIGGTIVHIGSNGGTVVDVDGMYAAWFADHGVVAALQRPDFVLFGTASEAEKIPGVLRALDVALGST